MEALLCHSLNSTEIWSFFPVCDILKPQSATFGNQEAEAVYDYPSNPLNMSNSDDMSKTVAPCASLCDAQSLTFSDWLERNPSQVGVFV